MNTIENQEAMHFIISLILTNSRLAGITPDTKALVYATIVAGVLAVIAALLGAVSTGLFTHWLDKRKLDDARAHKLKMDRAERLRQRQVKHYNSLVVLQWQFNEARAILEDNMIALDELIATGKKGLLTPKRPQLLRIDYASHEALADVTLVNMVNQYNYDTRRLNLDSSNITKAVDQMESLLLSGQISPGAYTNQVNGFEAGVGLLKNSMKEILDGQVMDICAYVRICLDKDSSEEMKEQFKKVLNGRGPYPSEEVKRVKDEILKELAEQEAEDIKKRDL